MKQLNRRYPDSNFWTLVTSVDEIETLTSLDFLAPLPDDIENRIEAQKSRVEELSC